MDDDDGGAVRSAAMAARTSLNLSHGFSHIPTNLLCRCLASNVTSLNVVSILTVGLAALRVDELAQFQSLKTLDLSNNEYDRRTPIMFILFDRCFDGCVSFSHAQIDNDAALSCTSERIHNSFFCFSKMHRF
jgi:hypothetical protein